MYKKIIQIDGLDSCLGEKGADTRFGKHIQNKIRDIMQALLFFCGREQED